MLAILCTLVHNSENHTAMQTFAFKWSNKHKIFGFIKVKKLWYIINYKTESVKKFVHNNLSTSTHFSKKQPGLIKD